MIYRHKTLAAGRWRQLSLMVQLANIGSEVERALKWQVKGNQFFLSQAVDRVLELFNLTIADSKNKKRLKEIVRARELLADYFIGANLYQTTAKDWQKYFYNFNFASRLDT